ncbi:MAG TPA: cytochrome c-type biogenesis protein CcmH [Myxococcota bacterium]|nr:cytochrome c-type biogenesis protein CcmH [Myxococcota bacterium]
MKGFAAILGLSVALGVAFASPAARAADPPAGAEASDPTAGAQASDPTAGVEASDPAAGAQASWSGELVDRLMSPYCPGRTLRSCPSPQAGELIVWIEAQEAEGRDRDAVYQQLLSEFGEEIRQAPEASGFGAAAYAIPVLAFLAGGAVVAVFLRRQGARAPEARSAPAPLDPELERLVDEELRRPS